MAVIKFPLRHENFQETEADSPSEGAYQYWEGAEFEGATGIEARRYDGGGTQQTPKTNTRKKTPSPAQIIAQSIRPAKPTQSPHKSKPSAAAIIANALQPTNFALAEGLLEHSFWQAWIEHEEYLRRKCLFLLGSNREDAEDALSTAMMQAFQHFTSHAGGIANMRAWLTTIVHNACMDGHRKSRRQRDFFSETEVSEYENIPAEYGAPAQSPEDIVRVRQSLEELYRLIMALPATLREPLLLRTTEYLSYTEIATRLNLTEANVRKRVQQARDQLRSSKKMGDGLAELLGIMPENH